MSVAPATHRLGVWLTLAAEAMFFLGIFGVVLVLRSNDAEASLPPKLAGGGWLLVCTLASAAASGPLSPRERARVRVISNDEPATSDPNHPHPGPLPEGEGTRKKPRTFARAAWAVVVIAAVLFLVDIRPALHWPTNPAPLPWAAALLAAGLVGHVLISLVATLRPLSRPGRSSVPLLWGFALFLWFARRLLL